MPIDPTSQDRYLMSRFLRRFQPARTIESLQILRDGFSQEPIRPPVTLDVPLLDVRTQDGRFNNFQIFEGGFGESGLDGDSGGDGNESGGSGDSGSGSGSGSGPGDSGGSGESGSGSGESGSGSGDSGSGGSSGGASGSGSGDSDTICGLRSVCGEYYGARFCPHGCAPLAGDYVCTTTKSVYNPETGAVGINHLCLCVQDVPCDWCEPAALNPEGCAGRGIGCDPPDAPCDDTTYPFGCCPFNILCCYDIGVTYFSHMETCCSVF